MAFAGILKTKLVSADVRSPNPLSPEQLQFYWANGYIVIRSLFGIPTLNLFRERFVEIANMPNASQFYSIVKDPKLRAQNVKPEDYINKIQELLHDEVYSKYSEDPAMLCIISQLLGSDLTAVNCMLINKPPGTQRHPPHQNLYYFPFRPADSIVAVWTAVDAVRRDNGCLYVVPGSHYIQTLYVHGNEATDMKQFYHSILSEDVAAPLEKRMYLEMEPGDTVLFHPYLVHGSEPNVSQKYRKAMTAHYASSTCHYIDPRGTPHAPLAAAMEAEIQRRGGTFDFVDLWRIKCKQVQGVKSNL